MSYKNYLKDSKLTIELNAIETRAVKSIAYSDLCTEY